MSLNCWNGNRLMKPFETVAEANQRMKTESGKTMCGEKGHETILRVITCGTRKSWRKR